MRAFKLVIHKITLFIFSIISRLMKYPNQLTFSSEGSSVQLARHITRIGHKRILLVTDKILVEIGVTDGITKAVKESGAELFVFDGVVPDPTTAEVSAGLLAYQQNNCDAVLALGLSLIHI